MACCLIVGAAPSAHRGLAFVLEHVAFDCVIAVDGGYAALTERGITPNIVAGDFDSLGFVPDGAYATFDSHKDFTDLDWALQYAYDQGFGDVVLADALSGRLDHSLGNLALMVRSAQAGMRVWGVTDEEVVLALAAPGDYACVSFAEGGTGVVSVMPHSDEQRGVTETGFEYGLDDAAENNVSLWGISNELIGKKAEIMLQSGSVWVFAPLAQLDHISYGCQQRMVPLKNNTRL